MGVLQFQCSACGRTISGFMCVCGFRRTVTSCGVTTYLEATGLVQQQVWKSVPKGALLVLDGVRRRWCSGGVKTRDGTS